jgi:hypothetical protein
VTSPFAPVLAERADELPPVFRDQFLTRLEPGSRLVLDGTMDRVWRRRRWLRPLFSLLARADLLFPETGRDVPARLVIDSTSGTSHRWRRTFDFVRTRRFDATMTYDPVLRRVVESLGRVEIAWRVEFQPPARIEIVTGRARLRLAGFALTLPGWLTPAVHAIEDADPARTDALHVELSLGHPWLGPVFGYGGDFRLRRESDAA